ncbi:hypothetical protein [Hylemonella gracilis]|uniref:Uncharacterized protein n=1 Tax=Hylemonella gracilis ATCC 19624 TaxID=887062 RepID=F3KXI0_9BURK|nr:hypothetical protein [Hylemonella gracilis]EGI75547.1 hypothetical protein HGR_15849 [Hylemonella gracilis ATCC 19624]
MNMHPRDAAVQTASTSVLPVTVDALAREIYESASPAVRAHMKAQACARVVPELTVEDRARLLRLLTQPNPALLDEIQSEEPDWASSGAGAALLWMVEVDHQDHRPSRFPG